MVRSTKYVCQQCGYETTGWLGRCPNCQSWGSLIETIVSENKKLKSKNQKETREIEVVELKKVREEGLRRIPSGIGELDGVLGGGIVPGQAILLAGEPGIGKSTLLLQLADKIYSKSAKKTVIYISGEESKNQIKLRAKRLKIDEGGIFLMEETDADDLVSQLSVFGYQLSDAGQSVSQSTGQLKTDKPKSENRNQKTENRLVIVDSIQTLTTTDLTGTAGSIGQVRECASRLIDVCKKSSIPLFLVGHVTKEGGVAGPKILEHMVDTVLWFEGDRSQSLRILRSVKNRFGPTDEVGIFSMTDEGLMAVNNPSELFLSHVNNVSGSVPTVILEGTRLMVVEIQSLVVPTKLPFPRHTVTGIDSRRLEMLLAVLAGRAGVNLGAYDVFVNAVGGISVREPGADLAIALSLVSALLNKPLPSHTAAFGEIGLLGEVRSVAQETRRLKEAKKLGFRNIINGHSVKRVGEAIKRYLR